jgi:hypothetical protein
LPSLFWHILVQGLEPCYVSMSECGSTQLLLAALTWSTQRCVIMPTVPTQNMWASGVILEAFLWAIVAGDLEQLLLPEHDLNCGGQCCLMQARAHKKAVLRNAALLHALHEVVACYIRGAKLCFCIWWVLHKAGFHRRLRQSFDVSSGCCSFEAIFSTMQLAGASVLAVVPVALMT